MLDSFLSVRNVFVFKTHSATQRSRYSRLESFFNVRNVFVFKTHPATHVVNFYSAGVVNRNRRIGSRTKVLDLMVFKMHLKT
jgi:hypothetical protein